MRIATDVDYSIDRAGNVRNERTGKMLKPFKATRSGHLAVDLPSGRKKVHHLVMEAFVGPRPDGLETRHLNNNPEDNRLENLAYGTRSQNVLDLRQIRPTCPHGHGYTASNTYIDSTGARRCRECKKRYRK